MRKEISSFVLRVNSTFKPLMVYFTAECRNSDHGEKVLSWLFVTVLSIKMPTSLNEKRQETA